MRNLLSTLLLATAVSAQDDRELVGFGLFTDTFGGSLLLGGSLAGSETASFGGNGLATASGDGSTFSEATESAEAFASEGETFESTGSVGGTFTVGGEAESTSSGADFSATSVGGGFGGLLSGFSTFFNSANGNSTGSATQGTFFGTGAGGAGFTEGSGTLGGASASGSGFSEGESEVDASVSGLDWTTRVNSRLDWDFDGEGSAEVSQSLTDFFQQVTPCTNPTFAATAGATDVDASLVAADGAFGISYTFTEMTFPFVDLQVLSIEVSLDGFLFFFEDMSTGEIFIISAAALQGSTFLDFASPTAGIFIVETPTSTLVSWEDLTFIDIDFSTGPPTITPLGGSANFQIELFADGAYEIRWGTGSLPAGTDIAAGLAEGIAGGNAVPLIPVTDAPFGDDGISPTWPANQCVRYAPTGAVDAEASGFGVSGGITTTFSNAFADYFNTLP